MTAELLFATLAYAVVTSITPGPNNAMLLASGLNFGFVRSVPHMLGINAGFSLMLAAIGLGIGAAFDTVPALHKIMRTVGTLYMLYLAWNIAHAAPMTEGVRLQGQPMSFPSAAAFQWVNPKAWVMAMGAVSTYLPTGASWPGIAILVAAFSAANAPCIAIWTAFGVLLRRWLADPRLARRFNIAMALALCATTAPGVIELLRSVR